MQENNLFEALLDTVPFGAYVVEIESKKLIYANKLMIDKMHIIQSNNYWKKIHIQNNICSSGTVDQIDEQQKDSIYEFFDEITDKWFISHNKYVTLFDGRKTKYSILVDITEQKENQGKIIQSHAKLSTYAKHLTSTNKNLQITKLLLQKKTDELEIINKNLEKIVEEQLDKLRKQDQLLFFYQKQESLDNIMSIIAHQWKQPLHELSINNIFLNEKNRDPKKKFVYKDNDEIIQFLSSTINAFQNFYQSTISNSFFIKEAIESTILILNSSFRQNNVNIDVHCNEETIELAGQRNIFSQVILSILENALTIFIERNIKNSIITISVYKTEQNKLIINIEDNAGGIAEENLPYIFENSKSFRDKPSSGLGLYIANLVISEKFNGKITANNKDQGAIFTISIPLC
ncbi:MAG: sensor histidine kinase [Candidatus Altimarinota bacterium]